MYPSSDLIAAHTFPRLRPAELEEPPGPLRAIIADDDPVLRRILAAILQELGYQAELAGDGEAALEAWARHGADLVVTDLVMPRLDGLALLDALAEEAPWLPVIAVTGAEDPRGRLRAAAEHGAAAVLVKPVAWGDLVAAIRQASGFRRAA